MIENPFESGHIKNYLLLYASVVLIMMLFFIASSFFNEIEDVQKKIFQTDVQKPLKKKAIQEATQDEQPNPSKFRLLNKAYN